MKNLKHPLSFLFNIILKQNKIHDYDDKWMNDLFTEDDWLCDPCLNSRFAKHKEKINDKRK